MAIPRDPKPQDSAGPTPAARDPRLSITLQVSASNPNLLLGLDRLWELNLVSDDLVRRIAREQLSCLLPTPPAGQANAKSTPVLAPAGAPPARAEATIPQPSPQRPRGWLQSFLAEVSVLWLLFLGLFMVVVSSAVLAASQWQNFSPVGQYGVLLSYTLAFWGAGKWAGHNPRLQLTAQMIQRVALLLVPINFWAVDGFGLWRSPLGWVVAVVVAIVLSVLLKQTLAPLIRDFPHRQRLLINVLALSWLHWGWGLSVWGTGIMPLLASYVAMVGTAINLVYPNEDASSARKSSSADALATQKSTNPASVDAKTSASKAKTEKQNDSLSITLVFLFGALLILGRAVLAAGVPVAQLGLAIGLCGAVLLWRERSDTTRLPGRLWSWVGGLLMVLGWLVSLQLEPPLQSFAVSLLGLMLLWDRLRRLHKTFDLTAIFLVGLQAIWLARRFAPVAFRQVLVDRVAAIAGTGGMPFAVVGVTLFPYLLLFVWLGEGFHRTKQSILARQALFLATALGFGLTLFSIGNPLMRALNLTFSAITLGAMARRRLMDRDAVALPVQPAAQPAVPAELAAETLPDAKQVKPKASNVGMGWIILLQILTLGAIFSWAYVIEPNLSVLGWSLLCLGCALLEWLLSITKAPRPWRSSAWIMGLLMAGLGFGLSHFYVLFVTAVFNTSVPKEPLLWWLVPLGLLTLAEHPRCLYPKSSRAFGLIALALVQPFGWMAAGTRLAGFGLATLVSGLHSRRWPRAEVVVIAVFWSIVFTGDLAWQLWPKASPLEGELIVWGGEVGLLFCLWGLLRPQPRNLTQRYGRAAMAWGITLAIHLAVVLLAILIQGIYGDRADEALTETILITAGLPCIGLAFALLRLRYNGAALGLGLFAGLGLAAGLVRLNANPLQSALAFLALAWVLLWIGELWLAQQPAIAQVLPPRPIPQPASAPAPGDIPPRDLKQTIARPLELSCHSLPLGYMLVGLVLGHLRIGPYSGLVTLIGSFILLGISRRHRPFSPLGYLGLGTASIGCFELLLYQLSQVSGGDAGDGLVLIGLLSIALAWGLRMSLPLLCRLLRLDATGLKAFAAGHWGLGTVITICALLLPLSDQGGLLWMGGSAIAGCYALFESRRTQPNLKPNFPWLDAAIVQLLCALGYAIHLLYFWPTLLAWAAAIACPIAMVLEATPWERWGWNSKAGQRWAALGPGIVTLLTAWDLKIQVLLIVAVFYAGLAQRRRQIRLGYISLALVDWALLRIFSQFNLTDILWFGGLLGANLLFLAQVDPQFGSQSTRSAARNLRHWLRCLGASTVCLSGLYQAEVGFEGLGGFVTGLLPIGLGLAFIGAGIALRVRAFLYVGTVTFVIRVLLQIWQYIQADSLFLWAIGIALGLGLIWIAATFEARRSQITSLMNYWVAELEAWD